MEADIQQQELEGAESAEETESSEAGASHYSDPQQPRDPPAEPRDPPAEPRNNPEEPPAEGYAYTIMAEAYLEPGGFIPSYVWGDEIITDLLKPVFRTVGLQLTKVITLGHAKMAFEYSSQNPRLSREAATALAARLTRRLEWAGRPARLEASPCTFRDRNDLVKAEKSRRKKRDKKRAKPRAAAAAAAANYLPDIGNPMASVNNNNPGQGCGDGPPSDPSGPSSAKERTSQWIDAISSTFSGSSSSVSGPRSARATPARDPARQDPKGRPQLPTFGGQGEDSAEAYKRWCFSLRVHQAAGFSDATLLPVVVSSLKGAPAQLAQAQDMGEVTVASILATLDRHYRNVSPLDVLQRQLYSMRQSTGESVAEFGIKIRAIIADIITHYPGSIDARDQDKLARDRFYEGLYSDYRQALTFKMDGFIKPTYEELLRSARALENRKQVRSEERTSTAGARPKARPPQATSAPAQRVRVAAATVTADPEPEQAEEPAPELGTESQGECGLPVEEEERAEAVTLQSLATQVRSYADRNNLCRHCLKPGHWRRECPDLPDKSLNSKRGGRADAAPPKNQKSEGLEGVKPGKLL